MDESVVERWRDLGPVLWLVAVGVGAAWAALLAALAFATRSRSVEPGAATLDLGGPEPPAVVNLLTSDWRLGHEAVPATLLDLAARRLVALEQVGGRTLVRVPSGVVQDDEAVGLEPYERMVLDHVRHHAVDGVVPAEALTTGPEEEARGWWRRFRRSVERDARRRGLSRKRFSPGTRTVLLVTAAMVALVVAVAATTLPDDPEDSDDDPVGTALALGALTAGALMLAAEAVNGERDTPAGREAARRWLGLRTMLAEDPLFAEHPPAGVAIWDRLLAYGATMGVAHGAVRALPLGAERDDEAWSSVGGHWRVVRIRYPRFLPPGYGRHPGLVAALGLFQVGLAVLAMPAATAAGDALLDAAGDFSPDQSVPLGVRVGVSVGLGAVVALALLLALRGASMTVSGIGDLVTGRRRVEGRALRVRRRGTDERPRWYVAVDDGTAGRIRAWMTSPGGAVQGSTVAAVVTRGLAHVRDFEVVSPAPSGPPLRADEDEGEAHAARLPTAAGAPPPLPGTGAVAAAAGRPLELDRTAPPHPMAAPGRSATYTAADGTTVQLAWIDPTLVQAFGAVPRILRRDLPGVGDQAYRAAVGGGVVARRRGHVLVVTGHLPGSSDGDRDRAVEDVARAAVETAG
ncbi:MAG TPA: hypothetical protein VHF24_14420 [Acidimicrobiales bacterium]|nr:hypothetical protein [Acidimicrobiales bacterium]